MPEDNSAYKAIYGIGTNFNNDIQISGATVSRYHATIKHGKDGKIYIFDHSKNGTTVDGIKITPNSPYRIKKKSAITCGGVPVDLSTRLPWPQSIWKPIATIAAAVIVLAGLGLGIKAIGKPSKYDDSELYAMYNNSVVFLQGVYHYKATGIPEEILKKYNFPVDFFIDREGTIRDVNSVPTETVTQNCSYSGRRILHFK